MGKKGTEIVKANVHEIVDDLCRAYADEWMAHYYYLLAANLASGINAPAVASVLEKRSSEELGHANKIARRIMQLGSEPPRSFSQLQAKANCRSFAMPEDPRDLEGILRAVLESERCAIGVYEAMVEKTRHVDPVTHELVEELLADEVADEEETENLLGMRVLQKVLT